MTPHLHSSMFAQKPRLMTTSAITQAHMLDLSYPPTHIKEKNALTQNVFPLRSPFPASYEVAVYSPLISYPRFTGLPRAFLLIFHIIYFGFKKNI